MHDSIKELCELDNTRHNAACLSPKILHDIYVWFQVAARKLKPQAERPPSLHERILEGIKSERKLRPVSPDQIRRSRFGETLNSHTQKHTVPYMHLLLEMDINSRSFKRAVIGDEYASWIMYEGHCTCSQLDVVIRLGDVQFRWTITVLTFALIATVTQVLASVCGVYLPHTWLMIMCLVLFSPSM